MTPTNNSIGILDSGVGGLSVLLEIRKRLPNNPIHYIGDSLWCPYGNKPIEEIQRRTFAVTEKLLEMGVSTIVVACNSATIHAVEALRAQFPIPFIGMEPAVKPASKLTQSGVIGVLATEASIKGEKFHKLLNTHAHPQGVRVITQPCPDFVTLVEQGMLEGSAVVQAVEKYTHSMLSEGADTIVLGCTHYPFLRNAIQQAVGSNVQLIDSGSAVAKRTETLVQHHDGDGSATIHTTGELSTLENLFPILCPEIKADLQRIEIDLK